MSAVTVTCDRCHQKVGGRDYGELTIGFYRTGPGTYWSKYVREGEQIMCDKCMFADAAYIADYGDHRMTDTLYDVDRPFGLPVKSRLILPDDPDTADAVGNLDVEVVDPRDFLPHSALQTYAHRTHA